MNIISHLTRRTLASSVVIAAVITLTVACSATPTATPAAGTPTAAGATPTASVCLRSDGNCLGPLAAGSYSSGHFATFGPTRSVGQLRYRVTDGFWANALDQRPTYWFEPAKAYAAGTGDDSLPGVFLWGDVAAPVQDFPTCPEKADPAGPSDAPGLAAWLTHAAGLTVKPVSGLQLGDHKAIGFDIVVDPKTAPSCSWGKFVPLVAGNLDVPFMTGINEGEHALIYFVDLGGGHTTAIIFDAPENQFEGMLAHVTALVSTFTFVAPK